MPRELIFTDGTSKPIGAAAEATIRNYQHLGRTDDVLVALDDDRPDILTTITLSAVAEIKDIRPPPYCAITRHIQAMNATIAAYPSATPPSSR